MLIGGSTIVEGVVPGSCSMAWPRPDVRRWRSRRGSKHQAKAQGRPFHPGATGERQTGRVKNLNLWLMSRYGQPRVMDVGGAQGLAAEKRQAPTGDRAPVGMSTAVLGVQEAPTPVASRACETR